MRNDIISSLALKRMCYILLRTWTDWWLNIRRRIKLAPSPQHLKQEKGKSREKKRKRGSSQLVITKEKEHALFSVLWEEPPLLRTLSRTLFFNWYSPTGNSWLWNPSFVYLKDRQGMIARPLQGKLFCQGNPGDCLELLHLRVHELKTVL